MIKISCHWCGKECKLVGKAGGSYYVRSCPVCMDLDGKESKYNIYDPDNGIIGTTKALTLVDTTIGAAE